MLNKLLIVGMLLITKTEAQNFVCELPIEIQVITSHKDLEAIPSVATSSWNYLKNDQKGEGVTRFLFVRHGESESNKNHGIAGRTDDTPLSELGVDQAKEVGDLLNQLGITFSQVYCSPMQRAINTAQYISPGATFTIDERLHEKFYGPVEGKTVKEYQPYKAKEEAELPKLTRFFEKFSYKPHPDFESMQEVYERLYPFLSEAQKKHNGETILVATHGGLMKSVFLLDAAKRGFETDYRSISIDNTALFVLDMQNDQVNLMSTTRISHK